MYIGIYDTALEAAVRNTQSLWRPKVFIRMRCYPRLLLLFSIPMSAGMQMAPPCCLGRRRSQSGCSHHEALMIAANVLQTAAQSKLRRRVAELPPSRCRRTSTSMQQGAQGRQGKK